MSKRWVKLLGIGSVVIITLALLGNGGTVNAQGNKGKSGLGLGKLFLQSLVDATVQVTGLTKNEIKADFKNGQSLADIIQAANKGTVSDVEAAAKQTITDGINQLVTDGKLSSTTAQKIINRLDTLLDKAIHRTYKGHKLFKGTATPVPTAAPTTSVE